ncbi:hypothetical protein GOBAR_DD00121 [Gossypium barbadense]|nr:hypothetical protein GOBAR_DD00121 [Gossypium barbadense]
MAVVDLEVNEHLGNLFKPPESSNFLSDSPMTTTHFNPTFEELEGTVVVLDGKILDPLKHSKTVFKENDNPNDGKALGDDGTDGIGKGVSNSKARGLGDKGRTS